MSNVNLADAKVSYEGQEFPAINLISKLQTQLQEAACQIAAIASTLGDLQASLLNSNTVEIKMTLSKEDLGRFRALGGEDDSERVRKAVMTLIHPGEAEFSISPVEFRQVSASSESGPVTPPAEFRPVIIRAAEPPLTHAQEQQPGEPNCSDPLIAEEPATKKTATTKCPRCKSLIDLPELSERRSVEVKCGNCGTKCLVKSKTVSAGETNKTGFKPLDEMAYRKLLGMPLK